MNSADNNKNKNGGNGCANVGNVGIGKNVGKNVGVNVGKNIGVSVGVGRGRKRFAVACGGTGGHVFPGLAAARALRARGHDVCVWLSGRDIEAAARGDWDGPVFSTGARPLSLRSLPSALRALLRCRREMRRFRPAALLAMGSYSSLAPVLAARSRRVPVLLHEANAVPGKANEFLSRFAARVAVSFDSAARWLPPSARPLLTGLPVRAGLAGRPPLDGIPPGAFTILVTGGSQGARAVNALVSRAACLLKRDAAPPFFLIHQCGAADKDRLEALYRENGVPAKVAAFFPDMGRAYAAADFAVCRAGASTCFELCALGKPALLIPLPGAVRDHQRLNAERLVRAGAADVALQSEMTPRSLMRYLLNKMKNPGRLERMSRAMKGLALPDAADRLADALEDVARETDQREL